MRRWTSAHSSRMYRPPQQTAGRAFHAGREQTAERAHGQVVLICTRKGVNDTADRQRHGMSAIHVPRRRTGPFGTRNSSTAMPISANGMTYAPLPMSAPDARCSHFEQHAVDRQDRQQAQQTDNAPDCAPDRTGQDRTEFLRLRLCRTLAQGALFVDFLVVVFLAAKTSHPSTFFVIQSDGVLRVFPLSADTLQVYCA